MKEFDEYLKQKKKKQKRKKKQNKEFLLFKFKQVCENQKCDVVRYKHVLSV